MGYSERVGKCSRSGSCIRYKGTRETLRRLPLDLEHLGRQRWRFIGLNMEAHQTNDVRSSLLRNFVHDRQFEFKVDSVPQFRWTCQVAKETGNDREYNCRTEQFEVYAEIHSKSTNWFRKHVFPSGKLSGRVFDSNTSIASLQLNAEQVEWKLWCHQTDGASWAVAPSNARIQGSDCVVTRHTNVLATIYGESSGKISGNGLLYCSLKDFPEIEQKILLALIAIGSLFIVPHLHGRQL